MTVITSIPVPADSAASWADHNGRSASWVADDAYGNSWYAWFCSSGSYEVVRITREGVQIQYGALFYGDDHTHAGTCDYCGPNRTAWVVVNFSTHADAIAFAQSMAAGRTANFVCKTRYTPPAVLARKERIATYED